MSDRRTLLAVPNVSEGRDSATIAAVGEAFVAGGARLLDVHSDEDHHRSVYTLAGAPGELAYALLAGIREALLHVDIGDGRGAHPHVGAVDVAPIVYVDERDRGVAAAEALLLADLLGERLELPVFLYGSLGGGRTRAGLRRGGANALAQRLAVGELEADFGPSRLHATGGATLVCARLPLVAFNVELAPPAGLVEARAIAARVREGGGAGLRGVRAIGVELRETRQAVERVGGRAESAGTEHPADRAGTRRRADRAGTERAAGCAGTERPAGPASPPRRPRHEPTARIGQVSLNIEDPLAVSLADVLAAVQELAAAEDASVAAAELVGLAPAAALVNFPEDVPLVGFDPDRHVIEHALAVARTPRSG